MRRQPLSMKAKTLFQGLITAHTSPRSKDAKASPTQPMIQTIVDDCLRDGQFDECDLTMRDLALIVDALENTVTTIFHHRIDYPGFDFNRRRCDAAVRSS